MSSWPPLSPAEQDDQHGRAPLTPGVVLAERNVCPSLPRRPAAERALRQVMATAIPALNARMKLG